MGKRTKKDLEAEIAALRARVDEQAAVIGRFLLTPAAMPVFVPMPCARPHADVWPPPYAPPPPYPQPFPHNPFWLEQPWAGGTVVGGGGAFVAGGACGANPVFDTTCFVVNNAPPALFPSAGLLSTSSTVGLG